MERDPKVFSSNIIRNARQLKNDLSHLLRTTPAQPVIQKKWDKRIACDFQPRTDKHFEPKKKTKFKVKTVRDIRNSFEKDIYVTLPLELDKQQNVLLRKIRAGSSREENTKALAKNILKCDKPISRSAWQMLMNLNPKEHAHSTQFVLWNGRRIQVNGSKGGKLKFICKYDLRENKVPTCALKRKPIIKRKCLLRNSLSVNFKPGPLTKKRLLDYSYQKYHVGGIDLLDLPMPGLEIQPAIGKAVDPTIAHCLHNMRQEDGTISDKWAEFSVSVLATVKDENIVQIGQDNFITFDLSYKSGQQRILMRRDANSDSEAPLPKYIVDQHTTLSDDSVVVSEIKEILDNVLDSVEISLNQDNMYTGEDEPRIGKFEESNSVTNNSLKDRLKRKCGELERLDVTIIRLSESPNLNPMNVCPNEHCALGCVCSTLECTYKLKRHCGRIECMFECKCDFSKYKVIDSCERDCSELIPGLISIDNEIISKMAKEEQKFHQTVIVTSENSMLLKSKPRDWKSSRKYAEFYSSMSLKTESKSDRIATVVLEKLKLDNVEPWCMIHNLYKCFCKCRFTENWVPDIIVESTSVCDNVQEINSLTIDKAIENVEKNGMKTRMFSCSQKNGPVKQPMRVKHIYQGCEMKESEYDFADVSQSARIIPFKGRKYSNEHYFNANKRIIELEKNDKTLSKRMLTLINISSNNTLLQTKNVPEVVSVGNITANKFLPHAQDVAEPICVDAIETSPPGISLPALGEQTVSNIKLFTKQKPDKTKLVAWLETSYKHYKQRIDQGMVKIALDPPKPAKMALYPWEFILGRYRDQKNLFLISKGPQYRIFMAVDTRNLFFKDCININDIRFADLHKYPITVKNLLTNAKDLKDNFCILCGLSHCWELIGSVTKVCEQKEINKENSEDENCAIHEGSYKIDEEVQDSTVQKHEPTKNCNECASDSSKWFVMTVENDFNEIQFYNKGFFVKLESIKKAINVARATGKTVRLSMQKPGDNTGPLFGIYAIPNETESCVFVGPYEKDELLGIETVNNVLNVRKQKRTRGIWITTKKLENFNVIDNPLSFMPPKNAPATEMMTLAGERCSENTTAELLENTNKLMEVVSQSSKKQDNTKVSKPIKIRKTNEFFHLAPNGTLKPVAIQQILLNNNIPGNVDDITPKLCNKSLLKSPETHYTPLVNNSPSIPATLVTLHKKPVAEIAPQVKTTKKSPDTVNTLKLKDGCNRKEKGMFVLKPEEINKRLMQNQIPSSSIPLTQLENEVFTDDQELQMDIENFLATSKECIAPNDDILIVSDDETDFDKIVNVCKIECWNEVWLECKTVESLGWIPGRKNKEGGLSFEFPGFKFTEFYKTEDAFAKLNQVLSRKVYIPRNINLEWQVVEFERDLKANHILKPEELGPDFVLTKRGIRHKQSLASGKYSIKTATSTESLGLEDINGSGTDKTPKDSIKDLEATSQRLDDENEMLWNKLTGNPEHSEALDDLREQIAARLQSMVSNAQ